MCTRVSQCRWAMRKIEIVIHVYASSDAYTAVRNGKIEILVSMHENCWLKTFAVAAGKTMAKCNKYIHSPVLGITRCFITLKDKIILC